MMASDKVKERWQNLIMYIGASLEQQETASSMKESEALNNEMYEWIISNYTLSVKRKKQKITIFDLMKNKGRIKPQQS
jgi:hypothetical protein